MIDTRNTYRAVPVENSDFWNVQYRRWFSIFWCSIKYSTNEDQARLVAIKHAQGDSRKTIHFGRLPE